MKCGFRSAIEYRESTARDGAGNIVGKVVFARDNVRCRGERIGVADRPRMRTLPRYRRDQITIAIIIRITTVLKMSLNLR